MIESGEFTLILSTDADINAAQNILAAGLAVAGRGGIPQALSQSDPMKRQPWEVEVACITIDTRKSSSVRQGRMSISLLG